jgi:hypothetical protein
MKKKLLGIALSVAMVMAVFTVQAFASTSITGTMTTAFGTVVDDLLAMIGGILPVALTVLGASMAVFFGVKWFKKIVGTGG